VVLTFVSVDERLQFHHYHSTKSYRAEHSLRWNYKNTSIFGVISTIRSSNLPQAQNSPDSTGYCCTYTVIYDWPFPNCLLPRYQSEARCTTFCSKITFICMRMKTHCDLKSCGPKRLSLRPRETTKMRHH